MIESVRAAFTLPDLRRRILFTTTNGARALDHARDAKRVLAGAAINRTALAEAVRAASRVAILCAGTDGVVAREDVLGGGAIIEALLRHDRDSWQLNSAAAEALVPLGGDGWSTDISIVAYCDRSNRRSVVHRLWAALKQTEPAPLHPVRKPAIKRKPEKADRPTAAETPREVH